MSAVPVAETPEGAGGVLLHLSLNVVDLERSVAFYQAFFGVAPHKRRPGYANFALQQPPLKLALNEGAPQPGVGSLNHLGLVVTTREEVNAARERLVRAGLATFDEGDTTCCFARQNKVWAHDPDGNAWEIYTVTDDLLDDFEHDHAGNLLLPGHPAAHPATAVPTPCCS